MHLHLVIQKLARKLTGRTLILVERIEQGNYYKQLMPEAHWISGKDKTQTKEAVFEALRTGENVIAVCIRHIITAGIDIFIHNMINASGGDADHNVIQQIGRGLRLKKDNVEMLTYYDFIFKTNKHLFKHSANRIKVLKEQGHKVYVGNLEDI